MGIQKDSQHLCADKEFREALKAQWHTRQTDVCQHHPQIDPTPLHHQICRALTQPSHAHSLARSSKDCSYGRTSIVSWNCTFTVAPLQNCTESLGILYA